MIGLRVVCNRIDLKSGGVVDDDAIIVNICLLLLTFQRIVIAFKLIHIIQIKGYEISLLSVLDHCLRRMEEMVSISKQIMEIVLHIIILIIYNSHHLGSLE